MNYLIVSWILIEAKLLTSFPGLTNRSAASDAKWAAMMTSAFLPFTLFSYN